MKEKRILLWSLFQEVTYALPFPIKRAKTKNSVNSDLSGKPQTRYNDRQRLQETLASRHSGLAYHVAGSKLTAAKRSSLTHAALALLATMATPVQAESYVWPTPDYYAFPNWALSASPTIAPDGTLTGGIHKFVDGLPGLCTPNGSAPYGGSPGGINNLGQCIPVLTPDKGSYAGSDYYKLEATDYDRKLHTDIPATSLRGYRETGQLVNQYLGSMIIATKNRPVRIKFQNKFTKDIEIPIDDQKMGVGLIQSGTFGSTPIYSAMASNKRAAVHLHGGLTPWISDGTPHQWITPAGGDGQPAALGFQKGYSFQNVPDMVNGTQNTLCIGGGECFTPALNDGIATLYFTNQQSGRLMWYHDHAYGQTDSNVYAGMAAPYLLVDPAEEIPLAAATAPGTVPVPGNTGDLPHLLPLVLQDKTFVPDGDGSTLGPQMTKLDPTWNPAWGAGHLWFPHVYMPNQFPNDPSFLGVNTYGRWDYGPWMGLAGGLIVNVPPVACTSVAYQNVSLHCPAVGNPSVVPESYADTPLVNGTAYPKLTLTPSAYRFHILNGANERFWNLGLYYAATGGPIVSIEDPTGSGALATATVVGGKVTAITMKAMGSGYTHPLVFISGKHYQTGFEATAVTTPVPNTGAIAKITVTYPGVNYYAAGTLCKDGAVLDTSACTEVSLIPSSPHKSVTSPNGLLPAVCTAPYAVPVNVGSGLATAVFNGTTLSDKTGLGAPATFCWPNNWPDDANAGQHVVPDPISAGPPIVQIGTEGGLLPQAVVIPSTPLGFEYNRRSITVLSGKNHGLLLGPAERANVIVDFTPFAPTTGKSVFILYNDGAAPMPGFDPRNDYFTGSPDQTSSGGSPSTLPGYGPNTRTLMQIEIAGANTNATPFNLATLMNTGSGVPHIFETTQDQIIVPEKAYPANNGGSSVDNYPFDADLNMSFPVRGPIQSIALTNPGTGYSAAPTVTIAPPTAPPPATPLLPCTLGAPLCVQATAHAVMSSTGIVDHLTVTGGSATGVGAAAAAGLYTTPPLVSFSGGGGGSGAAATAILDANKHVKSVTIGNPTNRYPSTNPSVTFGSPPCFLSAPNCVRATGTPIVTGTGGGRTVTGVTMTNIGAGYTSPPTVTFSAGSPTATGKATLGQRFLLADASLTMGGAYPSGTHGTGYSGVPTVGFSGGGGTGAAATAVLSNPAVVASIAIDNAGAGYAPAPATPPTVTIAPPATGGTQATATVLAPNAKTTIPFTWKSVNELFTFDTGIMNTNVGAGSVSVNGTNVAAVTTPYAFVDPTSEFVTDGNISLWRFQHFGVDTHYIHFHLFNLQLINRIGADGSVRTPNQNELGWKETIRMNPLEDVIVALRPVKPTLPATWVGGLPNSIRPLDVTTLLDTPNQALPNPGTLGSCQNNPLAPPNANLPNCIPFAINDLLQNAVWTLNRPINYGWEYVLHCHLLGHEENDMMRPLTLAVAPDAPSLTGLGASGLQAVLTWTDLSKNETDWTVQYLLNVPGAVWTSIITNPSVAPGIQFPPHTLASTSGPVMGGSFSYTTTIATFSAGVPSGTQFRVVANNKVGCQNADGNCANDPAVIEPVVPFPGGTAGSFDGWFDSTDNGITGNPISADSASNALTKP